MKTKKYKLLSVSGDADGAPGPCAFFASPDGCRNGDKCKFLHVLPDKAAVVNHDSPTISSTVSSESDDEQVVAAQPAAPLNNNPAPKQAKKKNKTKRKRAHSTGHDGATDDGDIFMKPKKHSASKEAGETPPSKKKKAKTSHNNKRADDSQQKATPAPHSTTTAVSTKQQQLPPQNTSTQAGLDFRSLSLPIASFSTAPTQQVTTPQQAVSEEEQPPTKELPVPNHTPTGLKWQDTVLKTRQHVRYVGSFNFDRMKEVDEEAGRGPAADWITARKFGPWCIGNPQAIAIDCEMCETRDPVTGSVDPKALCRVSVVNADNPDEVLLDTLVKPEWPVVDYRSRINGITKEHLENVQFTLRHAQAFLMALCSDETVIAGHALHNDLAALKMEHHCVVDSSLLYPVQDAPSALPSLKAIARSVLGKEMPKTHDSVNDARTALLCLESYLAKDGDVTPVERAAPVTTKLFVHRIPKKCVAGHLMTMFLSHTSIKPAEVEEIEFTRDTGKTHVTFLSGRHADLAFDTLEGAEEPDKSGRMQKKVYLKGGGYVRVRKMVHPKTPRTESCDGKQVEAKK